MISVQRFFRYGVLGLLHAFRTKNISAKQLEVSYTPSSGYILIGAHEETSNSCWTALRTALTPPSQTFSALTLVLHLAPA